MRISNLRPITIASSFSLPEPISDYPVDESKLRALDALCKKHPSLKQQKEQLLKDHMFRMKLQKYGPDLACIEYDSPYAMREYARLYFRSPSLDKWIENFLNDTPKMDQSNLYKNQETGDPMEDLFYMDPVIAATTMLEAPSWETVEAETQEAGFQTELEGVTADYMRFLHQFTFADEVYAVIMERATRLVTGIEP